jgi:hypothetical protein
MLWYTSKQVQWLIRERPHLVSVLASSAVDRGFEPGSDQTKDYIHLYIQ